MSIEEVSSRKAKKAQRDAERKKSGKKRKRDEEDEIAAAEQNELRNDFISLSGGDDAKIARSSPELPKKKRKAKVEDAVQKATLEDNATAPKTKKRRKSRPPVTAQDAASNGDAKTGEAAAAAADKASKNRFVLFIGNLPYSATDDTITAHFKSIQPFTLRHRVDKQTKKSKGFAFLEFENYDRMKTCLKLYHHSNFNPEAVANGAAQSGGKEGGGGGRKKKKDHARRINVELTAGGGGKGEERKEKIKVKNAKLDEQRRRRREAEEKAAAKKTKKQGPKKTGANADGAGEGVKKPNVSGAPGEAADAGNEGMHPARLARLQI